MQDVWFELPEGWLPEATFPDGHAKYPGGARCLHWIHKQGRQCRNPPRKGTSVIPHPVEGYKGKCRSHGGNARQGMEHHNYKTGRYGVGMKGRPARVLERLLSDDEILRLDDNIALIDLRIVELRESLIHGAGELRRAALLEWKRFWKATLKENRDVAEKHRKELQRLLEVGAGQADVWDEIASLTDTRRRLTDSETSRREKMRYMVLVEDTVRDYMSSGQIIRKAIMDEDIPDESKASILRKIYSGLADRFQISPP